MLRLGVLIVVLVLAAAAIGAAVLWWSDRATVARVWQTLESRRAATPPRFDPSMISDLPEAAQRYFRAAIAPGTPLSNVVTLEMTGDFLLNGTAMPMQAEQVLAPPADGFVWRARFGQGLMRIAGSDGMLRRDDAVQSWTRFGIWGVIPVARVGGSADHARAAGTRAMLEAVWAPAALLPRAGAVWEQTGPNSARIAFPALDGVAPMELVLDAEGHVIEVWAMRWANENPDGTYRLQPFGGRVYESRLFGGFTVPSRVEMGNHWGTQAYEPFFRATVTEARY